MPQVLGGFTIAVTGDRRADEQSELLRRRGATVVHGPTIETRTLADSPELRAACDQLIDRPPALVVATTGVGVRSWMEAADGLGLGDALRRSLAGAEVVARSPKAAGALHTADLPLHWQAPGERNEDVLAHLANRDLSGVRVAVQRDGGEVPFLAEALAGRGAEVVDVPVYRWILPRDPTAAHRLLDLVADGQVDALTITSAPALQNLYALSADRADDALVRSRLNEQVLVACVGPVCSAAARSHGLTNLVVPARHRLGAMVKALADALATTAWHLDVDGTRLRVQGGLATVDDIEVALPRRVQQVLALLARADGAVVAKSELGRSVWGTPVDPHVVEVTVARARLLLGAASGAVVTVPRRGYRLVGSPG